MKKRNPVIDILKGLAILAVVLDHTYGLMYTSDIIYKATAFSVTLFVLCSGINSFHSMNNANYFALTPIERRTYLLNRIRGIIVPYVVASAFCAFINGGYRFVWKDYLQGLFEFSTAPPFYFVAFFLTLILVQPIIYKCVCVVDSRRGYVALVYYTVFLIGTIGIAYLCTEHTYMGELYGGGAFLFGGSYLAVFAIGMCIAKLANKILSISRAWAFFGGGLLGIIIYMSNTYGHFLNLDIYPKWVGNPPGLMLLWYTLSIAGIIHGGWNLLLKYSPNCLKLLKPIEIMGKYSLYIFLYHFYFVIVLRNTLFIWFPMSFDNIWIRKGLLIIVAIVLPIIGKLLYNGVSMFFAEEKF